jgi:hypothetical protein
VDVRFKAGVWKPEVGMKLGEFGEFRVGWVGVRGKMAVGWTVERGTFGGQLSVAWECGYEAIFFAHRRHGG